jgi:hypothetical protein
LMWIVRKSVVEPPRTDNAPAVNDDARLSHATLDELDAKRSAGD